MIQVTQELMTPEEAAKWFRRSTTWLRQRTDLLRLSGPASQPLYHVRVCRAYVLGLVCGLGPDALRRAQIKSLAEACGLSDEDEPLRQVLELSPGRAN